MTIKGCNKWLKAHGLSYVAFDASPATAWSRP